MSKEHNHNHECECGCGCDDNVIITFQDKDGVNHDFEAIYQVEYNNNEYLILNPVEPFDDMENGDVMIFRINPNADEDEQDYLLPIQTEEEMNKVFEKFIQEIEAEEEHCCCEEHDHNCDCHCK